MSAVEFQGLGHTADAGRPMTIEALASGVVARLEHLGIAEADVFGFCLGGLATCAAVLGVPVRTGKLIVRSAGTHRPPSKVSAPPDEGRLPKAADCQAWRDPYETVAPDPAPFDEFATTNSAMVHEFAGWADELRSLQMPTLLVFGDRAFSWLPPVMEMFGLLPDAQLAVLPGTMQFGVTLRPGGEVVALKFLDER